eukprot:1084541-Amorphochlora_amoeboformis.AAC.1
MRNIHSLVPLKRKSTTHMMPRIEDDSIIVTRRVGMNSSELADRKLSKIFLDAAAKKRAGMISGPKILKGIRENAFPNKPIWVCTTIRGIELRNNHDGP